MTITPQKKIGRNDQCLCGSGKKYKHCCLDKQQKGAEILDLSLRNLRKMEHEIIFHHIMPFVEKAFPEELILNALGDFFPPNMPEEIDGELYFNRFFTPWFVFSWIPEEDFGIENFSPDSPLALQYMEASGTKLRKKEKDFISAACNSHYSFHSVMEVDPDKSLTLKDLFLESTHIVKEKLGSQQLKRGDVIFAKILSFEGQSILVGMPPVSLPSSEGIRLISLRQEIMEEVEITQEFMRIELQYDLLDFFFVWLVGAYTQKTPQLQNTDGELMVFCKSYFKLFIQPEEALLKLKDMSFESVEDILSDAKKNKKGEITEIHFSWHKAGNAKIKGWDNTILGHFCLSKNKMTLEVNSENRSKKGIEEISKRLGESVLFQKTLLEDPEQKFKSSKGNTLPSSKKDSKDLMSEPAVIEQLQSMAEQHWKDWFDQEIPNLNNQTPRQAAKTKNGQELLEALFLHYEREYSRLKMENDIFKPDIEFFKKELGLLSSSKKTP